MPSFFLAIGKKRLPDNCVASTSTIEPLIPKGNLWKDKDWNDLEKVCILGRLARFISDQSGNGSGDGFGNFDAVDRCRKNAAGKTCAFAGRIKPRRVETAKSLIALDADRGGGTGFHPCQYRIRAVKTLDLSAEGAKSLADGLNRVIRQA